MKFLITIENKRTMYASVEKALNAIVHHIVNVNVAMIHRPNANTSSM